MTDVKKGMRLSDIAGSRTVTKEEWEKVTKALELRRKLLTPREYRT